MRGLVSLLPLLAAASVGALPASGNTSSGTAAASFAKTDGLFFNIDGETKYYAGTNCYWCGFLTSDEDVEKVFSDMAAADLKIIRVWGFNDVNEIPGDGTVYCKHRPSPFMGPLSCVLGCSGMQHPRLRSKWLTPTRPILVSEWFGNQHRIDWT